MLYKNLPAVIVTTSSDRPHSSGSGGCAMIGGPPQSGQGAHAREIACARTHACGRRHRRLLHSYNWCLRLAAGPPQRACGQRRHARACVFVCMCACVYVCVCVRARMCVRVCCDRRMTHPEPRKLVKSCWPTICAIAACNRRRAAPCHTRTRTHTHTCTWHTGAKQRRSDLHCADVEWRAHSPRAVRREYRAVEGRLERGRAGSGRDDPVHVRPLNRVPARVEVWRHRPHGAHVDARVHEVRVQRALQRQRRERLQQLARLPPPVLNIHVKCLPAAMRCAIPPTPSLPQPKESTTHQTRSHHERGRRTLPNACTPLSVREDPVRFS